MRLSDPNGLPINAPSNVVFADATVTPINSPASPSAGKVTLVPPSGALYCVFRTADTSAFISDTTDQSKGKYPVAANADFRYPCYGKSLITIVSASAVSFFFEIL